MSYSDLGSFSNSSSEEDNEYQVAAREAQRAKDETPVNLESYIEYLDAQAANKKRKYPKCAAQLPNELKRLLKDSGIKKTRVDENWPVALLSLRAVLKSNKLQNYWYLRGLANAQKNHTSQKMLERGVAQENATIEQGSKVCVPFNEVELKKIFKVKEEVGRGGYGVVYAAHSLHPEFHPGHTIAVKCLEHVDERRMRRNYNEVFFLHTYKHANILEFGACYSIPGSLWITLEFLKGGSLLEACKSTRFKEMEICRFALEIGKALRFLHGSQVVHRDIKPGNIMIAVDQESRETRVKLVDFSLTIIMNEGPAIGSAGTTRYKSPEMTLRRPHHYPTDMWSLGITLLRLVNDGLPHEDCPFAAVFLPAIGEPPKIEDESKLSKEALHVITSLLQCDPTGRMTAEDLVDHDWMINAANEKDMWRLIKQCFRQEALNEILAI